MPGVDLSVEPLPPRAASWRKSVCRGLILVSLLCTQLVAHNEKKWKCDCQLQSSHVIVSRLLTLPICSISGLAVRAQTIFPFQRSFLRENARFGPCRASSWRLQRPGPPSMTPHIFLCMPPAKLVSMMAKGMVACDANLSQDWRSWRAFPRFAITSTMDGGCSHFPLPMGDLCWVYKRSNVHRAAWCCEGGPQLFLPSARTSNNIDLVTHKRKI